MRPARRSGRRDAGRVCPGHVWVLDGRPPGRHRPGPSASRLTASRARKRTRAGQA